MRIYYITTGIPGGKWHPVHEPNTGKLELYSEYRYAHKAMMGLYNQRPTELNDKNPDDMFIIMISEVDAQ